MKDIIFRGKRIDNGEWVEGDLETGKLCGELNAAWIGETWYEMGSQYEPSGWDNCGYEVDPDTVGQYTGLTDKKGKKIFEGDIVDASNEWWNSAGPAGHDSPVILVEWKNGLCGFEPFANYDCDCGVYINAKNCEVLGNIHDNPELLKDFNGGV